MITPKYPHIKVQLIGKDGNACAIVNRCHRIGWNAGLSRDELCRFVEEAYSSDYDNVIATAMRWFHCY